jgi:hypothetical protein
MIDLLLTLIQESPLLFVVFVINIAIVAYILIRIGLYFSKKKKPGRIISHFLWKMRANKKKGEMETVEEVYASIISGLKKEGVLGKDDKEGMLSRRKILKAIPEGEKRKILQELFRVYEMKMYGNRRILNEKKVVASILSRYAGI